MIVIIDYGMGNIHSVQKALELSGAEVAVTSDPKEIKSAEKVVLPGVGAFRDAMAELDKRGITSALREYIEKKKVFLGICLGMQLLFDSSAESKGVRGLGFIPGEVDKLEPKAGLKVPHMGWNRLQIRKKGCPLLDGVAGDSYVYFCHSYYPEPKDKEAAAATTDYGIDFTSVVWQENIYGVQFHPEKSQATGLKIVDNFVKLC